MPAFPDFFHGIDAVRRRVGHTLDRAGLAPIETPSEPMSRAPGITLARYGRAQEGEPVLLLVPAPIKRHYIWDLAPEYSVVRQALARRFGVYMIHWSEAPDEWGLDDYLRQMLQALQAVEADAHKKPHLLGHSLGGTLCATLAARYPEAMASLVLATAPLAMAERSGAFAPLLRWSPPAQAMLETLGPSVAGSVLNLGAMLGSPEEFVWERELDNVNAMALGRECIARHWRVLRWSMDELPMPGRLFADVLDLLYRRDELMRGQLQVHGRRVAPSDVKAPISVIIDERSRVVPPGSVLPFVEAASSASKTVMHYQGDIGIALQHVGPLVGDSARRDIWPFIFQAMHNTTAT
ncbi:MAG TPA: alpha/beta fold hydrolase [Burkholderiaceae bacterium]|nr:alpha/beta fold hydrolase [Burkholderiaceae bacterium]